MRLATQPLREFSHNSRAKIRIEVFSAPLDASAPWDLPIVRKSRSAGTPRAPFCAGIHSQEAEVRPGDPSPFGRNLSWALSNHRSGNFWSAPFSRVIRLFFLEDLMIKNKIEKTMKPIPVPYEEFESFPKHVEEFFDLIARHRAFGEEAVPA